VALAPIPSAGTVDVSFSGITRSVAETRTWEALMAVNVRGVVRARRSQLDARHQILLRQCPLSGTQMAAPCGRNGRKADLIVAWVRLPFLTDAIKNSGLGEG